MVPTVREILETFNHWTMGQCIAYRAGIRYALKAVEAEDLDEDDIPFYLRGLADAIGPGAEANDWFEEIARWQIQERWWEDSR